mgnify:CR=1 FL=1
MIISRNPISIAEVAEQLKKTKSENKELIDFTKKFAKVDANDAKKICEELKKLDLIKMKDEQIVKIIDIIPENSADLNKIFTSVTLDEEESKRVLDVIKQFK